MRSAKTRVKNLARRRNFRWHSRVQQCKPERFRADISKVEVVGDRFQKFRNGAKFQGAYIGKGLAIVKCA